MQNDRLEPADWHPNTLAAFTAFVSSDAFKSTARRTRAADRLSDASIVVYKAMFSRFVQFLTEINCTIQYVQAPEIYAFLTQTHDDKLVLGSGIQYRYVRLLERVFMHLGRVPNPMADLMFGPMAEVYKLEGRNQSTVVLTPEQITQFMQALPIADVKERTNRLSAAWKKKRDRALQCMILGSGLKVSEAVALRIDEIDPIQEMDGTLRVDLKKTGTQGIDAKHPTFYPHVTFLQVGFVAEVLEWMAMREKLPGLGPLMFPTHTGAMLDKSAIHRQIQKTFERAQIVVPRKGGRTLRNTFAITELQHETDLVELSEKLGLFEDRAVLIYANAMPTKEAS